MPRRWLLAMLAIQAALLWSPRPATCRAAAGATGSQVDARIAVATNFAQTAKDLAKTFEEETAAKVEIISGSTGKLYAQIQNGAPFDAFFAADVNRPALLEAEGRIAEGSRFTYALGTLVLWSPRADVIDNELQVLRQGRFSRLAVANPKLAPYGMAAWEVLDTLGLWDRLQSKIVMGQNIGQTYQFVHTANADLGFVALSQLMKPAEPNEPIPGSLWRVPLALHAPIEQQAVRLNANPTAKAFVEFLQTEQARRIIEAYGYAIPKPKAKTEPDPQPGPEDSP